MRYPCIMTNEDAEQLALDGLPRASGANARPPSKRQPPNIP